MYRVRFPVGAEQPKRLSRKEIQRMIRRMLKENKIDFKLESSLYESYKSTSNPQPIGGLYLSVVTPSESSSKLELLLSGLSDLEKKYVSMADLDLDRDFGAGNPLRLSLSSFGTSNNFFRLGQLSEGMAQQLQKELDQGSRNALPFSKVGN